MEAFLGGICGGTIREVFLEALFGKHLCVFTTLVLKKNENESKHRAPSKCIRSWGSMTFLASSIRDVKKMNPPV